MNSPVNDLRARIRAPGPKRILSCDGGGIRGLITVEILACIEAHLRTASGHDGLVLADYFDFTCGTSTGAIIAACVSAGMPVDDIRKFYVVGGNDMFHKAPLLSRFRYAYTDEALAETLRKALNHALGQPENGPWAQLGDPGLRTALMMVMRNHTTDSPWFVSNNPDAKYNDPGRADCNLKLPLWQLVRASTAAPTYFPAEEVTLGAGTEHPYRYVFVDGGVTCYNNPAFIAFEMATAAPYRMNWATGADRLLIVSVGTGKSPEVRAADRAASLNILDHAQLLPGALMNAATDGWDLACRTLGDCRYGGAIDREVGDMVQTETGPATSTTPKLFTYLRYDPLLTRAALDELSLRGMNPEKVKALDAVSSIDDLGLLGRTYGQQAVQARHFDGFQPDRAV